MVLARRSQRTLILPALVFSRTRFDAAWDDLTRAGPAGWRAFPLSEVFDVPYLVTCAAQNGVRVVQLHPTPAWLTDEWTQDAGRGDTSNVATATACQAESATATSGGVPPPDKVVPRLYPPMLAQPEVQAATHVRITDPRAFTHGIAEHGVDETVRAEQEALDSCILYTSAIRREALQLIAAVEGAAEGVPLSSLPFAHVRSEADFAAVFGNGMGERAAAVTAGCLQHIGVAAGAAAGEQLPRLFVATGELLTSPKLQDLRTRFQLLNKDAVAPAFVAGFRERWGEDILASLDQQLGVAASEFVGLRESSFSQQIARERLRMGKRSFLSSLFVDTRSEPPCLPFNFDMWPFRRAAAEDE